jgi:hypothetical protein
MQIVSRDTTKVKGRISITRTDGKKSSYAFQGTAKGLKIEFVTEKVGSFQQHFVGTHRGADVVFDWDGMTDVGYPNTGTAKLAQKLR